MKIKPSVSIASITFSGGGKIIMESDDKVILVGPNNSGKSQALREIQLITEEGSDEFTMVVKDLEIIKNGSLADLTDYLIKKADFELRTKAYRLMDWRITEHYLHFWDHPYLKGDLAAGFMKLIGAEGRLQICNLQESIGAEEHKSKPQHILYQDDRLMEKVSALFRNAFRIGLLFDYRGGKYLPIHVGEKPEGEDMADRAGDAYVRAVRKNPPLHRQGDGMKSFAGILFETVVSERDISLIDEPEAFLHPPQMRRLGETLSSEVSGQLIVATHSSDIMRGFLEGTQGKVRILRIRRDGDVNLVTEATREAIKELWEKPELRYSNALEGIFHEQTIICEDDSDCRLINAVADFISSSRGEQWPDTAYVPTGGKHGVPKVAEALRKIGVPIKAVFDIDFLREQNLVKATVDAFGGNWKDVKKLWKRVDSAVRKGISPKPVSEIKNNIIELVKSARGDHLPKREIDDSIKQSQSWDIVKRFGERAIPSGDAQKDYQALKGELEGVGIYLVSVGEIENFCREIGSHGPKFVTKLLSEKSLCDSGLDELRAFVTAVHQGPYCRLES